MIALKERTKIEITFDTFVQHAGDDPESKIGKVSILTILASRYSHIKKKKKSMNDEDITAQLEVLKNVKQFLTEKLKKNDDKIYSLENDIKTLKNLLRIEKQVNQKEQTRIGELERELKEERTRHDEKETEIRDKVNYLETNLREKERNLQILSTKYAEIKAHKKLLRQEVLSLMEQVKTSEYKLQNSESSVNAISEFFNNNTLLKLEKLKERKSKKEVNAS
jgi:chromosome segregation ATPase